jgi:glycerate kinase
MEAAAERMAGLLCDHCGKARDLVRMPGSGAAGGIAFGLMCAARARLIPGADLVAAWLDLGRRMAAADVIITGEGRFDASSLQGKGPGGLVARAVAQGKPALVFCGSAVKGLKVPPEVGIHPISPEDLPLAEALARASEFLEKTLGHTPIPRRPERSRKG